MSELICIAYPAEQTAGEVLAELKRLSQEKLIALEDASAVVRDADGKVQVQQSLRHGIGGATASGALLGSLLGLLVLNPVAGAGLGGAVGAGTRALASSNGDHGLDDDFVKEVGASIPAGSSALFLLVEKASPDAVVPQIARFGGKILRTEVTGRPAATGEDAPDSGENGPPPTPTV